MRTFTVYEEQTLVVAHEVEAEDEYHAMSLVQGRGLSEYDYIVESDTNITSVELTEE